MNVKTKKIKSIFKRHFTVCVNFGNKCFMIRGIEEVQGRVNFFDHSGNTVLSLRLSGISSVEDTSDYIEALEFNYKSAGKNLNTLVQIYE